MQAQGDIRILGGIGSSRFQGNFVEGQLLHTLAGHILVLDRGVGQVLQRHGVHVMPGRRTIQYIGLQHGVKAYPVQSNIMVSQYVTIVFKVMTNFCVIFTL